MSAASRREGCLESGNRTPAFHRTAGARARPRPRGGDRHGRPRHSRARLAGTQRRVDRVLDGSTRLPELAAEPHGERRLPRPRGRQTDSRRRQKGRWNLERLSNVLTGWNQAGVRHQVPGPEVRERCPSQSRWCECCTERDAERSWRRQPRTVPSLVRRRVAVGIRPPVEGGRPRARRLHAPSQGR